MKLTLNENIRAFRKQRGLTQEQLAEVLGVTAGAVYKWESGLSAPELGLIVEMADFFDTSVDVLLGYQMKDNHLASTVHRLNEYCRTRAPEALAEAEKALKKYPNSFEVVHGCASVYLVFGVGSQGMKNLRRALELLEQARLLIGQNTNPRVGELTICGEIAEMYMLLGEKEKGVELLKKNNIGGIFNAAIGVNLAVDLNRPEEAAPFLSEALLLNVSGLINTVIGYVPLFCSRGDFASARAILAWEIELLRGLRKENTPDFIEKVYVILYILTAYTQIRAGNMAEARASVEKAAESAARFDAAPDYSMKALRYAALPDSVSARDSLGATAEESAENILRKLNDRELTALWKERVHHG